MRGEGGGEGRGRKREGEEREDEETVGILFGLFVLEEPGQG